MFHSLNSLCVCVFFNKTHPLKSPYSSCKVFQERSPLIFKWKNGERVFFAWRQSGKVSCNLISEDSLFKKFTISSSCQRKDNWYDLEFHCDMKLLDMALQILKLPFISLSSAGICSCHEMTQRFLKDSSLKCVNTVNTYKHKY